MGLIDKLKKNSTIKESSVLESSKFFNAKDMISTSVPALNIALSGSITGGLTPGLTTLAGKSRNFKSGFALMMAKAYLEKYEDAALLFLDSEFGTHKSYFESFKIDTSRVLHTPITDIEQLKFDVMKQLMEIERGDRLIIIIDSIGNIASKKEVEDTLNEKSVADMTRAKQIKSLFRMVTPHLNLKDIPMIAIAHTYDTQEMFSKAVISGGTGILYSSDTAFIIGRQQEKDGKEVSGYNFVINVEKSRFVREKSKIPIHVDFEKGMSKWSGLMDIALEGGFTAKPKNGWYCKVDTETGELEDKNYRLKDTDCRAFWEPILKDKKFQNYIEQRYKIGYADMIQAQEEPEESVQPTQEEDNDEICVNVEES